MLRTKINIVISFVGAFLGFSAFICFCIVYANIEAGVWALLSGIKATLSLILHCHYFKGTLKAKFSRKVLKLLGDFGVVGFVAGLGLTIFYAFLQIYWQNPMMPVDTSIVIRLVWSFMMMKWGALLYLTTRKYLSNYNEHHLSFDNPNIEEM